MYSTVFQFLLDTSESKSESSYNRLWLIVIIKIKHFSTWIEAYFHTYLQYTLSSFHSILLFDHHFLNL